jgi:sarcosine oxidase
VTVHGVEGSTVHTDAGPLTADRVVVAAGPWATELLSLPLTVVRKVQLWFPTTRQGGPVFLHEVPEGVFYGFPAHEGRIKVAEHTGGDLVSCPLQLDRSVHASDVERVAAFVQAHLPGVGTVPVAAAVCMYTMSPDGHFRIGSEGPVSWVAGLSGHGFKFAPVLGSIMADLVEGRTPALDLDPFTSG